MVCFCQMLFFPSSIKVYFPISFQETYYLPFLTEYNILAAQKVIHSK